MVKLRGTNFRNEPPAIGRKFTSKIRQSGLGYGKFSGKIPFIRGNGHSGTLIRRNDAKSTVVLYLRS